MNIIGNSMFNLEYTSEVHQWAKCLNHNQSLGIDETQHQLRPLGWHQSYFKGKEADRKLVQLVTSDLQRIFEGKSLTHQPHLEYFATQILHSKRIQKHAPEELAGLERWLVGIQTRGGKEACYQLEVNQRFFHIDPKKRDPRLLGVSQVFAERHPDFAEFAIRNHLYYQMARTNKKTTLKTIGDEPQLRFAEITSDPDSFAPSQISKLTKNWEEAKQDLIASKILNPEDYSMLHCHMTKWGLVKQHDYEWERMQPITKVAPPAHPNFQIVSYHAEDKMLPNILGDQGHVGMTFTDSEGYVYNMGFFCHPDDDFYKFLKTQRSVLRAPDRYESRVDNNWQNLAHGKQLTEALPAHWNEGLLQFSLKDDTNANPCTEQLLNIWKAHKKVKSEQGYPIAADRTLRLSKKALSKALKENTSVGKIQMLAQDLSTKMKTAGIKVEGMTAQEKFKALMGRVHDLQQKTLTANKTNDWSKGALPYMTVEQNCTHVARYYFGQWVEINLGGEKDPNVTNTRPINNRPFLPLVPSSPYSRLQWAWISTKYMLACRLLRIASLLPGLSMMLGRGTAQKGITPRSSLWTCIKNFNAIPVTPQMVREEAMQVQFKIHSLIRTFWKYGNSPSGLLPKYFT